MKKVILLALFALSAGVSQARSESPVAVETSPPGDIPDNQSFVTYSSSLGYSIKIPEGWARKEEGATVNFSDKYNNISLQLGDALKPIDEAFAKANLVPELQNGGRAVSNVKVQKLALKSGPTIALTYDSNSEPNAVTNKQVREENETLYFVMNGKQLAVTLSAPKGADNTDQWLFMANSFRWK